MKNTDNDFILFLDNDQKEKMSMSGNEFLYEKKEMDSDYNSSLVRVTPSSINFYEKHNLVDSPAVHTYSFKVDKDLTYMKMSETYTYGSTLKLDTSTCLRDGVPSIREVHRKYNKDGHLVMTTIKYENLNVDTREFIKDQLSSSNEINRLSNYMEDICSGISPKLAIINPDYDFVSKAHLNNKKYIKQKED